MDYLPQSDAVTRQLIDAITIATEFQRVRISARAYAGGMYWKRQGDAEYLVKTHKNNQQSSLGRRSSETEKIHADFTARKQSLTQRLSSLREAFEQTQRMNKALKVGRVPSVVVSILRTLEEAGLSKHFTVVGTHALYAYEMAAGVRIVQDALATQDVDLLWDARKRVRFMSDLHRLDVSMLSVLQRADSTFIRKEGQNETAINHKGFEIDFLRRQAEPGDPHPFRFSNDEGDLWRVQAINASVLTNAPRFQQWVVASTGQMALMETINPKTFVAFKRWMAAKAPYRPEVKRRRDENQASIVEALLTEGLLIS